MEIGHLKEDSQMRSEVERFLNRVHYENQDQSQCDELWERPIDHRLTGSTYKEQCPKY